MKTKVLIAMLFGLLISTISQAQWTAIPDSNFEQALIDLGIDDVLDGKVLTESVENVDLLYVVNKGIQNLEGIAAFSNLKSLHCGQNSIVNLDFSENLLLEEVVAQSNNIEVINTQNNANLKVLALASNNLSTINVTQNLSLETLQLTNNNLTNIDLSQNTALIYLQLEYNNISNIDLQHNSLLEIISVQNNNLSALNTMYHQLLTWLNISDNPISYINLSSNTLLEVLNAAATDISHIDLNNIQLVALSLADSKIKNLDVSNQTRLTNLIVANNELTFLNVKNGNNQNFTEFAAMGNPDLNCIQVDDAGWAEENWRDNVDFHVFFSENCGEGPYTLIPDSNFEQALIDLGLDDVLDGQVLTASVDTVTVLNVDNKSISDLTGIEAFTSLLKLNCTYNELTSLNVSNNIQLEELRCGSNELTQLDLSNNENLKSFIAYNNLLSNLNLNNPFLTWIDVSQNEFTTIDLTSCVALEAIGCEENQLTEIDLSANSNLIGFLGANNLLETLDFTGNPLLYHVSCYDNKLTSIILDNPGLVDLKCQNNLIETIETHQSESLEILWIFGNKLTSLDVSANTSLKELYVFNNELNELNLKNGNNLNFIGFDVFNNPNLSCIQVDDPAWSEANWTNLDSQMYFSAFCGASGDDSDGDGVPDDFDDFPMDELRAFDNYFPAAGYGSLAYEDLWPGTGDYDFNDVVVDYRFEMVTNASNKVVEVFGSFVLKASGASLRNGFGFNLPAASTNLINNLNEVQVSGHHVTESFVSLLENGFEAGQSKPTIIVFDDFYNVMEHPGSGLGINTEPDKPFVEFDTLNVLIKPNEAIFGLSDFQFENWNPFIIVNNDRGREIHLADHAPTDLVDVSVFGSYEDSTDPSTGRYYKTSNNLPWAIHIIQEFVWPQEKISIVEAYHHFFEWANSSGTEFDDWYENHNGYRDDDKLYLHE